ncbi:MAG: hypothetical protein QM606_02650 [Leucobacter sp.]
MAQHRESSGIPLTNAYFSFDLPGSWEELDLKPLTRDRSIKYLVDARVRDIPEFRPHRGEFVAYLRRVAAQAWDGGARYCAAFCRPAGDGLITGSLTVTVLPSAPGDNPVEDIVEQLQQRDPAAGDGLWSSLTHVELPGGGAGARQFGVREVRIDAGGTAVKHVFMYTFLPIDGAVVMVACASPAVDLADPLLELFGHVSDTFVIRPLEAGE